MSHVVPNCLRVYNNLAEIAAQGAAAQAAARTNLGIGSTGTVQFDYLGLGMARAAGRLQIVSGTTEADAIYFGAEHALFRVSSTVLRYENQAGSTPNFEVKRTGNGTTARMTIDTANGFAVYDSSGANGTAIASGGSQGAVVKSGGMEVVSARLTSGSGTGITVDHTGRITRGLYRVDVTVAALAAAALTADKTIATLPARTRLVAVYADLTTVFSGGGAAAAAITLGKTAGGSEYLTSFNAFAATLQRGLVDGDLGAAINRAGAVQGADVPSWGATTAVQMRLTCDVNTNLLTQGSVTVWLIVERIT